MANTRVGLGRREVRRGRGDDGAALVEFAILAPVLFLILFGVVEFGYAFYQTQDVRHGARETARLVAVNYANTANAIVQEGCNRMDKKSTVTVRIQIPSGSTADVGGEASVTVTRPLDQITGFLGPILNGKVLTSTVETRLEQKPGWASTVPFDSGAIACVVP